MDHFRTSPQRCFSAGATGESHNDRAGISQNDGSARPVFRCPIWCSDFSGTWHIWPCEFPQRSSWTSCYHGDFICFSTFLLFLQYCFAPLGTCAAGLVHNCYQNSTGCASARSYGSCSSGINHFACVWLYHCASPCVGGLLHIVYPDSIGARV